MTKQSSQTHARNSPDQDSHLISPDSHLMCGNDTFLCSGGHLTAESLLVQTWNECFHFRRTCFVSFSKALCFPCRHPSFPGKCLPGFCRGQCCRLSPGLFLPEQSCKENAPGPATCWAPVGTSTCAGSSGPPHPGAGVSPTGIL